jgi:hypothetical protein
VFHKFKLVIASAAIAGRSDGAFELDGSRHPSLSILGHARDLRRSTITAQEFFYGL